MADLKISQLTGATTPLAGTEILPLVQSGVTKKVSVADLTAGRAISTGALFSSYPSTTAPSLTFGATAGQTLRNEASEFAVGLENSGVFDLYVQGRNSGNAARGIVFQPLGGNVSFGGNTQYRNAGTGINFTANTPAAGMTSQLLNWYEEGTFTPTITSGTGTITTLGTVNGQYTRIGNKYIVNVSAVITTNGTGAGYILMSNLPTAGDVTQLIGSGNENAITGKALTMSAVTTTSIAVTFYDATYPGANGASLRVCLTYQA